MSQPGFFTQPSESADQESYQAIPNLRRKLLRYCEFLSGSRHDAEDLVQTTMLKALPVLKGTQEHPNVTGFLRRIAKNTWLDQVRKTGRHQLCDVEDLAGLASVDLADQSPLEEAMQVLVRRLTPQQRAVILLCDVFQYTDQEAADLLRISLGAVKATLHRARLRLEHITEDGKVPCSDELQKEILQAYVSAFQASDIRMLVHFCQGGVLDPVLATTKVLTFAERQGEGTDADSHNPTSMLAAA